MQKSQSRPDTFVLTSGRIVRARDYTLGIREVYGVFVTHGYADHLRPDSPELFEDFTTDERNEIAKYAIELWRKWAAL